MTGAALLVGLAGAMAGPSAAGLAPSDDARGVAAAVDRIRLPGVASPVHLDCAPRLADDRAAVGCTWRAGDDVSVRSWQLWRIQVRPVTEGRVLVAEVGADARSHVDLDVTVPAAYRYAVLGLDGEGEIVARSRVVGVTLVHPDVTTEPLRLACVPYRAESDRAPSVAVGCEWSPAESRRLAGYVIWKQIDGGDRRVVARVGADTTTLRDAEVAFGHRYAYVVTAVDSRGEVIARSRAETVAIPVPERPDAPDPVRPTEPEPVRPAPESPVRAVDTIDAVDERPSDRARLRPAARD